MLSYPEKRYRSKNGPRCPSGKAMITGRPGQMGRVRPQQPSERQKMDESPFGKGGFRGISQPRNNPRFASEGGFALVAAILACVMLFALAMLVIHISTQDLRSSAKNVGDKKASAAAETGIHRMMQNFDPTNLSTSAVKSTSKNQDGTNAVQISGVWYLQVNSANDPNSRYTIGTPTRPTTGPSFLPLTGYSVGGGQSWGQARYVVDVTGRNTSYDTTVTIGTGFGYGPIEISTMSR